MTCCGMVTDGKKIIIIIMCHVDYWILCYFQCGAAALAQSLSVGCWKVAGAGMAITIARPIQSV